MHLLKDKFILMDRFGHGEEKWLTSLDRKAAEYPAKAHWYFFTASGKAIKGATGKGLAGILEAFEKLPEADRRGLGDIPLDERYQNNPNPLIVGREWDAAKPGERIPANRRMGQPPDGTLVLRAFFRALKRDDSGSYAPMKIGPQQDVWEGEPGSEKHQLLALNPAQDLYWLTQAEWQSLVPQNPKYGDKLMVADGITTRFVRFALVDTSYIFGASGGYRQPGWRPENVRKLQFGLTVEEVLPSSITLRLQGDFLLEEKNGQGSMLLTKWLEQHKEVQYQGDGYEGRVHGRLVYDRAKKVFTRFDMVALGDQWGFAMHQVRPRHPLGFAFELAPGDRASDIRWPYLAHLHADYLPKGN
jgi:hypothetical protein